MRCGQRCGKNKRCDFNLGTSGAPAPSCPCADKILDGMNIEECSKEGFVAELEDFGLSKGQKLPEFCYDEFMSPSEGLSLRSQSLFPR